MISKRNSNRGGALLSVVIVMAIAGILGALAISIAYTNFTMKAVDKKAKDNFYSAEKVLEEICVGLEKEASDQYKVAYTAVMSEYSPSKEIEDMQSEFKNLFVVGLIDEIKLNGNSSKYDVGDKATATGLYQYVKNNYGTANYTISSTDNRVDTLEDGLALRNVNVTYQDGNYFNEITTDIKISIPAVHFSKVSAMPEIAEYSFIAEGGTEILGSSNPQTTTGLNLVGKAYNGVDTNGVSITLNQGSHFDASNPKSILVVSKGEVSLAGSSVLKTGNKTAFWADSIETETASSSNTIDLEGRTYVKDDTTLSGSGNTLKLSGQYYGFSNNDSDASGSSSIIINGRDTSINMSDLDTLVVAGTSFVGTKAFTQTGGSQGQDILMGDSIAIKSNQLAYLVPTECAGITSNPMTYAQYSALPDGWQEQALGTYISMIRGTIASYGDVQIVPVFEPDTGDGGTVYLYLNFANSDVASRYYMDYYKVNRSVVDNYLNTYLQGFQFSSATNNLTRIVTQGNYLIPFTGTATETSPDAQYVGSTGDAALAVQELTNYSSSFNALCKKLITNESALTSTEKEGTVYSNIVDEVEIEEFIEALKGIDEDELDANVSIDANDVAIINGEVKVIVVDNNGDREGSLKSAFAYNVSTSDKKGLIIATGDVTISGDWEGLIICGGKLNVIGTTSNLVHNPEAIGKAMQMGCEVGGESFKVLNFFTSGNNYVAGSFGDAAEMTDVRNCISYENYKSE